VDFPDFMGRGVRLRRLDGVLSIASDEEVRANLLIDIEYDCGATVMLVLGRPVLHQNVMSADVVQRLACLGLELVDSVLHIREVLPDGLTLLL